VIDEQLLKDGSEARVFGGPGTGKTTALTKHIERAAAKYGGENVLVTSFTRAAAAELAGRTPPIPPENLGTLHSCCFRALGRPKIAEGYYDKWNRDHPGYRLSQNDATVDQPGIEFQENTVGDELYGKMQILRARMVTADLWPGRVSRFARTWSDWKHHNGLVDFTDLLEESLDCLKVAPRKPSVIVVDEAQDLSRLQLELLRQWGRHAEYLLMAMDDDQTILGFAGAAPEVLLERQLPDCFQTVLKQSNRIPRAVHKLSDSWIRQVALRQPKQYIPRDADGEVRILQRGNYKHPEPILNHAEQYLGAGKTVMFLTTCAYMLEPLKAVLRKHGIPFHNPYRTKRRDWNPMASAGRILAYLRPRHDLAGLPWRISELRIWVPWLQSDGILLDDAPQLIAAMHRDTEVTPGILAQLFLPEVLIKLIQATTGATLPECLAWWIANLQTNKRRAGQYLSAVALHRGVNALTSDPQVIVGTGHSVKGGQADAVYIFPDLSPCGARQWEGSRSDRDAVIRLGYVMMTRARETLVVCDPVGTAHMPIGALARKVRG
jgi:superfamily I DNA/RNA helicase